MNCSFCFNSRIRLRRFFGVGTGNPQGCFSARSAGARSALWGGVGRKKTVRREGVREREGRGRKGGRFAFEIGASPTVAPSQALAPPTDQSLHWTPAAAPGRFCALKRSPDELLVLFQQPDSTEAIFRCRHRQPAGLFFCAERRARGARVGGRWVKEDCKKGGCKRKGGERKKN